LGFGFTNVFFIQLRAGQEFATVTGVFFIGTQVHNSMFPLVIVTNIPSVSVGFTIAFAFVVVGFFTGVIFPV
jgi:hypothetical protein